MDVLASFESDGPTAMGVVAAVVLCALLVKDLRRTQSAGRRAWTGAVGGALAGLAVFGSGGGDMDGLAAMFVAPVSAIIGAIVGAMVEPR